MRKMMNAIMLSCRKATELVEKRRHCTLSNMENVQLKMHLSICRYCSNYAKQAGLIDQFLNQLPPHIPPSENTAALEEKIIKELKEF